LDLDAYLTRIGWRGPLVSDLATLAGLLDRHMSNIPFENLDVLLGKAPKLDLASLAGKLVDARRGGYCYEHATLFAHVLDTIGFTVHRHSARVTVARPKSEAPRTHMFLSVELPGGTVICDPGFGASVPRVPLALVGTPAGDYRIAREAGDIMLMDRDKPLWTSTLERDFPIDFEMANHFTATSPLSPFTRTVTMRAFTADGRITIYNRTLTEPSGAQRTIADGRALREICRAHFGFDLPALDALQLPAG
jgi:N-hydroxyarylamine O-acetyltransferase